MRFNSYIYVVIFLLALSACMPTIGTNRSGIPCVDMHFLPLKFLYTGGFLNKSCDPFSFKKKPVPLNTKYTIFKEDERREIIEKLLRKQRPYNVLKFRYAALLAWYAQNNVFGEAKSRNCTAIVARRKLTEYISDQIDLPIDEVYLRAAIDLSPYYTDQDVKEMKDYLEKTGNSDPSLPHINERAGADNFYKENSEVLEKLIKEFRKSAIKSGRYKTDSLCHNDVLKSNEIEFKPLREGM